MVMLLAIIEATKTALAILKSTLILQAIKMQLLLKVKAIEMLLLTMLGKILTGLLVIGQKRRRQRCLCYILEVVKELIMMLTTTTMMTMTTTMMMRMMMIAMTMLFKGGEGQRTTESIRSGLKDARVVKGLVGDKVAAMMMMTMKMMMMMMMTMMMTMMMMIIRAA